ncbi:MAG: hypothetical protein MK291_13350, partial [Planctomycetes bacterium]|nr:hypothetical protein [Planctomycetota bacterium]
MSLGRLHREACASGKLREHPRVVHPTSGHDEALKAPQIRPLERPSHSLCDEPCGGGEEILRPSNTRYHRLIQTL